MEEEYKVKVRPLLRGKIHMFMALSLPFTYPLLSKYNNHTDLISAHIITFLCSIANFTASAILHLKKWQEPETTILKRIDYSCIFLMVGGSFMPSMLFLVNNDFFSISLLMQWMVVIIAIVCILASDRFQSSRWFRTLMYYLVSVPNVFMLFYYCRMRMYKISFLMFMTAVFYVMGGIIYSTKVPNIYPGIFGYHELFHFLCLLGFITTISANNIFINYYQLQ